MDRLPLEPQQIAEPLDDATRAALDQAEAEVERGEVMSLEQSNINLKKRIEAWRKAQEILAA